MQKVATTVERTVVEDVNHFKEFNKTIPIKTYGNNKRKLFSQEEELAMKITRKENTLPVQMCRLCLSEEGTFKPLFGRDGQSKSTLRKVENTLQIKVKELRNMPNKICVQCLVKVRKLGNFIADVKANQLELVEKYGEIEENGVSFNVIEVIEEQENLKPDHENVTINQIQEIEYKKPENGLDKNEIILEEAPAYFEDEIFYEVLLEEDNDDIPNQPDNNTEILQTDVDQRELVKKEESIETCFTCGVCESTFLNETDFMEHKWGEYSYRGCEVYFEHEHLLIRSKQCYTCFEVVKNFKSHVCVYSEAYARSLGVKGPKW